MRNKLQVYYLKRDGGKTLSHVKQHIRQVTGKKVNALRQRSPMVPWGKLESYYAKTEEAAKQIFSKLNILNINKALFYDETGNATPIYEKKETT